MSSESCWEHEDETAVAKPGNEAGSDYEQVINGSTKEELDGTDSE